MLIKNTFHLSLIFFRFFFTVQYTMASKKERLRLTNEQIIALYQLHDANKSMTQMDLGIWLKTKFNLKQNVPQNTVAGILKRRSEVEKRPE
jgi:hypothetical protein